MSTKQDTTGADNQTDQSISDIDAAINAASARKAAKSNKAPAASGGDADATVLAATEKKRTVKTPEERKAALEKIEQERLDRRTKKDAERLEKQTVAAASRAPAHMKKVDKAAATLGVLSDPAQLIFNDATTNLTTGELAALAAHLQHFNRAQATQAALTVKLVVGATVTVIGGDTRYIGKTGTLERVQRIRCYVKFPGVEKLGYFMTSEVQAIAAPEAETPAPEEAPAASAEAA